MKLIAAALALVIALVVALAFWVFSTAQSRVRAYSTDKRLEIYEVRYFGGTNYDYSYLPLGMRIKYECQELLGKHTAMRVRKIGIQPPPWKPVGRTVFKENGPALVVLARLNGDVGVTLHLVANDGRTIIPGRKFYLAVELPTMGFKSEELLIFDSQFSNGDYHLQYFTETNDLAIIRLRQ